MKFILISLYLLAHLALWPEAWRRILWSSNSERWKLCWCLLSLLVPLGGLWYLAFGESARKPTDLRRDEEALACSARVFARFCPSEVNYATIVRSGSKKLRNAAVLLVLYALVLLVLIRVVTWRRG